jgi:hypothetical protein
MVSTAGLRTTIVVEGKTTVLLMVWPDAAGIHPPKQSRHVRTTNKYIVI